MSKPYDPRVQGKPNTTDILTGQEDLSQQPQEGSQAPPQAAQPQGTAQAAQPQQNAPQSNLATNKPKASSGMFTNVRQYIEKNKPAAQNMAGAASKQFTNTSDIIKKQMGSALGKYSQSIGAKQKEVDQLRRAGQSQVDQIVNAPVPQQTIQPTPDMANQATGGVRMEQQPYKSGLTREDILNGPSRPIQVGPVKPISGQINNKFQTVKTGQTIDPVTGAISFFQQPAVNNITAQQQPTQVEQPQPEAPSFYELGQAAQQIGQGAQGLNVNEQLSAAERLKQRSDAVNTEQGRLGILRDVFGQNRQYTQGSQLLDNLLLASNQQAADTLASNVRQAGQSAFDEVTQGSQQAKDMLGNLKYTSAGLGQDLENYRQQAITGLQSDIDANREQFVADRQAAIEKELADAIAGISSLQESQAGGAFKDLSSLAQALNPYTNRGYDFDSAFKASAIRNKIRDKSKDQFVDRSSPLAPSGKGYRYEDTGDYYSDRIKLDADAFDQLARDYNLADLGINVDDVRNKFFEGSKKAGTNKRSRRFKASSAQAALDMINERLSNINAEEFAKQKLEEQYGTDLDTLLSGGDLEEGQYYSMDQDQVDRINKLKDLNREQDLLQIRDYLDTDEVADFDEFDRIINKYKV